MLANAGKALHHTTNQQGDRIMSRSYDEHLDRLSNADYEAECGGQYDCFPVERDTHTPVRIGMLWERTNVPDDKPMSPMTRNWTRHNGNY